MTQLIYFKSSKVTKIQSFFVNYLQTVIYVSVQHPSICTVVVYEIGLHCTYDSSI